MTMLPSEPLAYWPGRWRHPELARKLARGDGLDTLVAASCVLRGLADGSDQRSGLDALLDQGEYALVEQALSGECPIAEPDRTLLTGRLNTLRRAERERAERERDLLLRRAVRTGLVPQPRMEVGALAESTRADADTALAALTADVADAERRLQGRLLERLEAAGGTEGWRTAVRDCVEAGEFPAAESMLAGGPGDAGGDGHRGILRPPPAWNWPDRSLEEIFGWYATPNRLPFPALTQYVPDAADVAGRALVAALAAMVRDRNATTVQALASALAGVLGAPWEPDVQTLGAAHLTRLHGLDDSRLPRLSVLTPDGVGLWISPPDTPPPAREPRTRIWLVPELRPSVTASGAAVLGVAHLLLLLVRSDDGTADPAALASHRRLNLLRMIVHRLGPIDVAPERRLDLTATAPPREALARLLDLWGVDVEATVLDCLVHETSGPPTLAYDVVEALVDRARTHGGHRIALADLDLLRAPNVRSSLRGRLLEPIREDAAARLALGLAYLLHTAEDFTAEDLHAETSLISDGADDHDDHSSLWTPGPALTTLTTAGILEDTGEGRYRCPHTAVRSLLLTDADWDPERYAADALRALRATAHS